MQASQTLTNTRTTSAIQLTLECLERRLNRLARLTVVLVVLRRSNIRVSAPRLRVTVATLVMIPLICPLGPYNEPVL